MFIIILITNLIFNQYSFSKEIDQRINEGLSDKCKNCLSKSCKETQSKIDFDNVTKNYTFLSKKDEKEFLTYKNKKNLDFKVEAKDKNIYNLYALEKDKDPKKFVLKCNSCNKECEN